jgi:hypothetical protein
MAAATLRVNCQGAGGGGGGVGLGVGEGVTSGVLSAVTGPLTVVPGFGVTAGCVVTGTGVAEAFGEVMARVGVGAGEVADGGGTGGGAADLRVEGGTVTRIGPETRIGPATRLAEVVGAGITVEG